MTTMKTENNKKNEKISQDNWIDDSNNGCIKINNLNKYKRYWGD
jgi:hypothetical protein